VCFAVKDFLRSLRLFAAKPIRVNSCRKKL
jgi:hypothetical protein